jgi:hypothetical protein
VPPNFDDSYITLEKEMLNGKKEAFQQTIFLAQQEIKLYIINPFLDPKELR